ncbi:hypothetical protein BX070DRAFT_223326 [Coemansia spiralis]|nr:hypothetical protein BX070DRAFT_223326 [Coemansia spiralis]
MCCVCLWVAVVVTLFKVLFSFSSIYAVFIYCSAFCYSSWFLHALLASAIYLHLPFHNFS